MTLMIASPTRESVGEFRIQKVASRLNFCFSWLVHRAKIGVHLASVDAKLDPPLLPLWFWISLINVEPVSRCPRISFCWLQKVGQLSSFFRSLLSRMKMVKKSQPHVFVHENVCGFPPQELERALGQTIGELWFAGPYLWCFFFWLRYFVKLLPLQGKTILCIPSRCRLKCSIIQCRAKDFTVCASARSLCFLAALLSNQVLAARYRDVSRKAGGTLFWDFTIYIFYFLYMYIYIYIYIYIYLAIYICVCVCILLESGHRSPCPRRCHHVPLQKGMSKGHGKRTGGSMPPYSHGFRQHALSFFFCVNRGEFQDWTVEANGYHIVMGVLSQLTWVYITAASMVKSAPQVGLVNGAFSPYSPFEMDF